MLKIERVDKWFGEFQVLKDVTLYLDRGQILVLCGASGSGKSTLLRCIDYLEPIQQGKIEVDGIPVNQANARKIRREVGMVFQHFNIFPHMTTLRNVTLGMIKTLRMPKTEAEEIAMNLLEKVGMPEKAHLYPGTLSGGQLQRVAIARALAMHPKLMLFDEPTSALDPEMIREVLDVMRDLAKEGMTMVIVTHEMSFAREVCDKVAYIDEGRIIETGDTKSFFENPREKRTIEFLDKIIHH